MRLSGGSKSIKQQQMEEDSPKVRRCVITFSISYLMMQIITRFKFKMLK